jgi:hypothetical protein
MKHTTYLRVHIGGTPVGAPGTDSRGRIHIQYDAEWLKSGFNLSPDTLAFDHGAQLPPEPQEFNGLHGVFFGSLPDGRVYF